MIQDEGPLRCSGRMLRGKERWVGEEDARRGEGCYRPQEIMRPRNIGMQDRWIE